LCTYVAVFLCGVRWRHNRAPNLEPRFWSFFPSLRKDIVANYAWIWTPFTPSVTGPDVLFNALNDIVPSIGGATRFAKFAAEIFQNAKKSAAELCQILPMVTIELVINSIRLMDIPVTISYRYALSFMGRCFCF